MNSRREFIKTSAIAAAGLSAFNIGRAGISPNEQINHASFGANGMAFADLHNIASDPRVNLVAVAEVDLSRLGRVLEKFPGVRVYRDWRVLLEKEHQNLDSVNVSTPDHMHAPIAIPAMKLGLHVYGQKPLAHNLYETRRMAEVAKETGVVTQMGIQVSSTAYERLTVQMIQDGVIGKVKEVHMFSHKNWGATGARPNQEDEVPEGMSWDLWCGVGPRVPYIGGRYYHPGGWRRRLDYGTGTLGDMGAHIFSPMFGALNLHAPLTVKSVGGVPSAYNWALNEHLEYTFAANDFTVAEGVKVIWSDGEVRPPEDLTAQFGEKMPQQGCIFVGTKGVLLAPHQERPVPYPLDDYADYRYPRPERRNHYGDYVEAVAGGSVKPLADFVEVGGPLTETILLGGLASRFPQQELNWDPENLRFTNHEEANRFIRRAYRDGWQVDGL